VDPLLGLPFSGHLLEDHHLVLVIQGPVDPEAAHARGGEPVGRGVHAVAQPVQLADRGDRGHDHRLGRRGRAGRAGLRADIELLHHLAGEHRRDLLDPGRVEPGEHAGRAEQHVDRTAIPEPDGHEDAAGVVERAVDHHVVRAQAGQPGQVAGQHGPPAVEVRHPVIGGEDQGHRSVALPVAKYG
jgi:hypothetical protein